MWKIAAISGKLIHDVQIFDGICSGSFPNAFVLLPYVRGKPTQSNSKVHYSAKIAEASMALTTMMGVYKEVDNE